MSFLEHLNFFATVVTFGCFSFAVTNFGIKLGKLSGFKNTSGYKYISQSENQDKLFEETVKLAKADPKAPKWAQNEKDLKNWCNSYQNSLRHWENTSKYCLIQNTARHKLVEAGFKIKTTETSSGEHKCTEDILNGYADNSESLGFLLGKKYCTENGISSS